VRAQPAAAPAPAAAANHFDDVFCCLMQAVSQGLRPQEALHFVVQQMDAAGGSFKSMQKHMRRQQQQQQQQRTKHQQQQQAPSADLLFAIAAVHGKSAAPGEQVALGMGGKPQPFHEKLPVTNSSSSKAAAAAAAKAAAKAADSGFAGTEVNVSTFPCPVLSTAHTVMLVGEVKSESLPVSESRVMSHPVKLPECAECEDGLVE
jgi:hypothetical protein